MLIWSTSWTNTSLQVRYPLALIYTLIKLHLGSGYRHLNVISLRINTGIVGAVQNHYSITEGQVGFLQTVFVTSYMVCSPIFGYFGDRYSRKWIMVIGTTLSMLAVFTGSFMEDYTSFLIMRAILGVGQASFATVSPTIISDMFANGRRSKMLALFYATIPIGGY